MTPSAPMLRHEDGSIDEPSCERFAVKLFGSSTWNMLESVKSRVAVSTTCCAVAVSPIGGVTAILKRERDPPWTTTVVTSPLLVALGSALVAGAAEPAGCATAGMESVSTAAAPRATSGRMKRVTSGLCPDRPERLPSAVFFIVSCISKRLRFGRSLRFEGVGRVVVPLGCVGPACRAICRSTHANMHVRGFLAIGL